VRGQASKGARMPRAALYATLLYSGLVLVFIAMYLLGSTQFELPKGPPLIAAASVVLVFAAMEAYLRRRRGSGE
jgi:lipopolysaccharide export LptBFGC system permease protein LptF